MSIKKEIFTVVLVFSICFMFAAAIKYFNESILGTSGLVLLSGITLGCVIKALSSDD